MGIQLIDGKDFDDKIKSADKPVIVDFYADWCGPCKMLAPILESLADEQKDEIVFLKLNVDDSPDVAARYSVQSIPTLISFKGGQLHNTMVGPGTKQKILELIK